MQYGWDFNVSQLGPSKGVSTCTLYQTANAGCHRFRYGAVFDQSLVAKEGFVSFGLLDIDNPVTWVYDQILPNEALVVFPRDDYFRGGSPVGFRGSGLHFREAYLEQLVNLVYRRSLAEVLPPTGIYLPEPVRMMALRAEVEKWRQLTAFQATSRLAIVSRREETLAIAILDALGSSRSLENPSLTKSNLAVARALEFIHGAELENISAVELCNQAGCSQRSLETGFLKRFGVTPKKYIKCLRLARVHESLRKASHTDQSTIIELAGIHGFWHMGQFAADYRRIYGQLPSETLKQT